MSTPYILQVPHPEGGLGDKIEVRFPRRLIEHLRETNPVKYQNFEAVREILLRPLAVLKGIREEADDMYYFVGRPRRWCIRLNTFADFPPHLVYVAYVNAAMELYNFRAEKADPDEASMPLDYRNRYGRKVWPSTS